MEPQYRGNLPLLIGVAAILLLLGIVYYFYFAGARDAADTAAEAGEAVSQIEVGTEISSAAQTPAEKLPETNPYSDYKNPFE